ncbi:Armadillo repeat-containing protein 7 [Camellia lanceoleosa]|uniref:Armadillo repeat-containing protein 7 n=1 Tax=Camellia lanceoleosa TaxID=1840588 RepID=A0ACC0GUT5_9ERIC|nr:Armadillo repeat-containing protein 7 [Camellia lanceoleosa]
MISLNRSLLFVAKLRSVQLNVVFQFDRLVEECGFIYVNFYGHIDIFGLREATKAKNHDENAWDWRRPLLATKAKNLAESKERIVANLANFAYDPYNYTFLRQLNILELFLDCLTKPNEKLVEFGVGGIYNSCIDPANTAIVNQCGGIPLIIQCLSSPVRNTVKRQVCGFIMLDKVQTAEDALSQ